MESPTRHRSTDSGRFTMRTGVSWRRRSSRNIRRPRRRPLHRPSHQKPQSTPEESTTPTAPAGRRAGDRLCGREVAVWGTSIRFILRSFPTGRGRSICTSRTVPIRTGPAGRPFEPFLGSWASPALRSVGRWMTSAKPD